MAFSVSRLLGNLQKYFGFFYNYLLQGIYWGTVPAIILYGLFAKPYSPVVTYVWQFITGQQDNSYNDPYGMPPGYGMPPM